MKSTLDILIPQYNEDFSVVKPLLDSLAIQQCIDFSKIGVIIVNDGSETIIDEENFKGYPFRIQYFKAPHNGVSATRNECLNRSKADYVMFCDIDDMFSNVCGLWIVAREMDDKKGFDALISNFIEETRIPETKEPVFINHEMDSTFVHGKVYRRKYLKKNKIMFNPKLTIHEDSFFNILAQNCSENVKYCPSPFYLWKWRDDSVCRHDPKYILRTYRNMVDSNTELIHEFKARGKDDKAKYFVCFMIFDAYYTMCKPEWKNQDNQNYRHETELRFRDYYKEFKKDWESVGSQDKMQISNGVRGRSVNEGMQMENITIDDWLKHVSEMK